MIVAEDIKTTLEQWIKFSKSDLWADITLWLEDQIHDHEEHAACRAESFEEVLETRGRIKQISELLALPDTIVSQAEYFPGTEGEEDKEEDTDGR